MSTLTLKSTRLLLIVITLFSFWLRVGGIQFGLPFSYHIDEWRYVLPALRVVSGNFQPETLSTPEFYPYLIGLVYALTYWGLRLFDAVPSSFELSIAWSEPMTPWTTGLIYLGRYISVASGILTTLVIYQLGRRAYSRETGVGAAIIFGLSFLPAREAHFAVSDAPVALGVAITLYMCIHIVERGQWSDYLWAGLGLGLSVATKYSAGLLILPIGVAHLLSRRYHSWSERLTHAWLVLMTGLIGAVSYLLVSPHTLLEWERFWADFTINLEWNQELLLDPQGGAMFYLKGLIWGFSWPIFLLFLGAVLFVLWRRQRADIVLLILPVAAYLYMQRHETYFVRWLLPLLPPMAVLAAETVCAAIKRIDEWRTRRAALAGRPFSFVIRHSSLVIITLFTLPSTYMALQANHVFAQLDTRTEALYWIQDNIPPGSGLAVEILGSPWGPPLTMPGLSIGPYHLVSMPNEGAVKMDLEQFRGLDVQYVIVSHFYYARPLLNKEHESELASRMQILDEHAELVALFQPYRYDYDGFLYHDQVYGPANDAWYRKQPGPIIKIYRLP